MRLYFGRLSGHSHRVRLFLSLIDAPYEAIEVDLAAGEHKATPFLRLNRFGEVPVLDDNGIVVPDSNAILVYLAKKFRLADWLPEDAVSAAKVTRWLSVAAGKLASGPCTARLITLFGHRADADEAIARSHDLLSVIEAELSDADWITGLEGPTIADVALYSYVARAPEGNVDLSSYANVRKWLARIEALPGFLPFVRSNVGLAE